jgi:hypothetical protein
MGIAAARARQRLRPAWPLLALVLLGITCGGLAPTTAAHARGAWQPLISQAPLDGTPTPSPATLTPAPPPPSATPTPPPTPAPTPRATTTAIPITHPGSGGGASPWALLIVALLALAAAGVGAVVFVGQRGFRAPPGD